MKTSEYRFHCENKEVEIQTTRNRNINVLSQQNTKRRWKVKLVKTQNLSSERKEQKF